MRTVEKRDNERKSEIIELTRTMRKRINEYKQKDITPVVAAHIENLKESIAELDEELNILISKPRF